MSGNQTREEVDAKLGRVAAETDTKIVRLEGKIDLVLSEIQYLRSDNEKARIDLREDNRVTRSNQWAIAVGLATLIIAIAALSG